MIFWDTSALVRAYDAREPHHARTLGMLTREGNHSGSLLLYAEAAGAVARRLGGSEHARAAVLEQITADLRRFNLWPMDMKQVEAALRLIRSHSLRGADAVHLAAALEMSREFRRGFRFCSADEEQLKAARACGLRVIEIGR